MKNFLSYKDSNILYFIIFVVSFVMQLLQMKKVSFYLMLIFYVLAGINHFLNPRFYEAIMPAYLGYHLLLIYLSGVYEITVGLLLIPAYTRKFAAILIIVMLLVFLWLHVQMLIDYWVENNKNLWFAIVRIPVQFILIWWAYSFVKPAGLKHS